MKSINVLIGPINLNKPRVFKPMNCHINHQFLTVYITLINVEYLFSLHCFGVCSILLNIYIYIYIYIPCCHQAWYITNDAKNIKYNCLPHFIQSCQTGSERHFPVISILIGCPDIQFTWIFQTLITAESRKQLMNLAGYHSELCSREYSYYRLCII